jgi:hypothetical protein
MMTGILMAATDQENVNPSIDCIINVHSTCTVRSVRAVCINGSAKETRKQSRGSQGSNEKKIELLLCFIDDAETAFALANDVKQYYLLATPGQHLLVLLKRPSSLQFPLACRNKIQ